MKNNGLHGQGIVHPENRITVTNLHMPLVEYQGQRVVTFAMVDEAHQRPKGTAKVTFSRNRSRFIDGEDFFIVPASEVEWCGTGHLARGIKHTGKKMNSDNHIRGLVTILTESGYLLLTKPLNDDLSWQVQRQLVKAYFRHVPQFRELRKVHVPTMAELLHMPALDAQNLLVAADRESYLQHGRKGSMALHLRRSELRSLRPALRAVAEFSQIVLPCEEDRQ